MTGPHGNRLDERRRAQSARSGDLLVYALGRPLMFIAWALVLWGTAVVLAAVALVIRHGGSAARAALLPRTALALANTALGVVALIVWAAVIVAVRRRR